VLVGRDREVGLVLDVVSERSSCALVGEAGIGKTAVLHAVCDRLGAGAVLGGAVQPLRWMPYLALQRACGVEFAGTRAAVVDHATAVLAGRALLVDDLHWADPDMLELLPELAHEVPVVVALRTDDPESGAALAVAEMLGPCISIEPLDPDAADALARATSPDASDADVCRLVAASGGNPLLLTCLPAPTIKATDDRLVALVTRASQDARYALARMALYGRPSWDEECEVIRELDQLGLVVRADDRGWVVRHDLFGQAAVALLAKEERLAIHRLLAEASETDGERARHYMHAGEPRRARSFALQAAETAASRNERADHLAIAVTTSHPVRDADLILNTAEALALAGRVDDGLAYALAAAPDDRAGCLRRQSVIAWSAWWAAQHELVMPALEHAMPLLTPEDTAIEVKLRLIHARYLARVGWDPQEALVEARRAAEIAEREGHPVAEAYGALGSANLVTGSPDWDHWYAKSIAAARVEDMEAVEITSADSLLIAQMLAGDPNACAPLAREMIQRSRAIGSRTGEMQFRKNLVLARFHVEDAVEDTVAAARELLALRVNPRQRDHLEAHLVLALADLGMDEEIGAVLATAYGLRAGIDDQTARATILWAKAEADWLAGRSAEAYETAQECRSLPVVGFPTHVLVEPIRQWAAYDLGIDPGPPLTDTLFANLVAANKESRAIVTLFHEPNAPKLTGHFLAAVRSWDRLSRRNAARAAWGAAEAARQAGNVEVATQILRMLERELVAAGRRPLLRRVQATMRALNLPVRAYTGTPFPPLTAAQVEVLELVGRGLDTHAIARRLVISDGTVESHVRQAMQRLGMPTRLAAAVELLRRRGDLGAAPSPNQRIEIADAGHPEFPTNATHFGALPIGPWTLETDVVAAGVVHDADDAARAVIAAARGASLVIALDPALPTAVRAEVVDALSRICPVERCAPARIPETDESLRDALRVLAAGGSVSEAAYEVHVSERTLHRRLKRLRAELGVTSNVAAARAVLGTVHSDS
jgi:DNA-binding NarL/FixJ family response regulator